MIHARKADGGSADPVTSLAAKSFDLRPFAAQDKRLNAYAARIFRYLGIGFSGLGVGIAAYLAIFVQFDPWVTAFLLVLFTGVGFGSLLLTEIPERGWRPRVELRLDDQGIALVDSAGRSEWLRWDEPAAVVTIRQIVGPGPSGEAPEAGEWLLLIPVARTAHIGKDAREGILSACDAHGFVLGEDRFDVANPADHGQTAVAAVLRMAARPPPGGGFGPRPSSLQDPLSETLSSTSTSRANFTAPATRPSYTAGAAATEANPVAAVTVGPEGAGVVLRDGKALPIDWRLPKLWIQLFAPLPTPMSALKDAPAWRFTVRRPACEGSLSSDAYAALTESARAAGLRVTTARLPRPDGGSYGWGAITTINPASPPRRGILAPTGPGPQRRLDS
jgi:hypothetical protein